MPIVASVESLALYRVKVTWIEGARAGYTDIVDVSSLIEGFAFYKALRGNKVLFDTVHVAHDGNAIAWLAGDELDMAATAIEHLALMQSSRTTVSAGRGDRKIGVG